MRLIKISFRLALVLFSSCCIPVLAQSTKDHWVDSIFNAMSFEEKVGQLFMVRISNGFTNPETINDLEDKIRDNKIGGILYSGPLTLKQSQITKRLQGLSAIPLMMGLNSNTDWTIQIDSALALPSPVAQSAFRNDSLIYFAAKEVARQMKLTGLQVYFIPVNSDRKLDQLSYGEDRSIATSKTRLWLAGIQSENVEACAKYFPIKGLQVKGIEKGFPSVQLTVDSIPSAPFKSLFSNGLRAVMPAATELPLFYESKKIAKKNKYSSAALSSAFTGSLIRSHFQFQGLIFIDVPGMNGSSDRVSGGSAEVLAFQSGNDVLITTPNINAAVRKLKKLIRKEEKYSQQLTKSVKKILAFKYDAGVLRKNDEPIRTVAASMRTEEAKKLQQKLYHSAVTVANNSAGILPIRSLDDKKFFVLMPEDSLKGSLFSKYISKYVSTTVRTISEKTTTVNFPDSVGNKKIIIAALFPETSEATLLNLLNLAKEPDSLRDVVVCDFGNVAFRKYAHEFRTVITAYDNDPYFLKTVPQNIFGALPATGVLPVSFGGISHGTSVQTEKINRLSYSFPEDVAIDPDVLEKIEAIANEAIENKATPGCNVLIARDGKVIYEKSFGHLTYEKQIPVTEETIYDLASITKVAATLQSVMFMYDRGLININKKASYYLPELKNSNKKDFTLIDILTHQSGLWPFLLFWPQTMADTAITKYYYNDKPTPDYPFLVSDKIYASKVMKDSLWTWIVKAKIREKVARTPFDVRYSDMGFYIMQHLAEKVLNQPLDEFVAQNLYEPLGASSMGYLPLRRFPRKQIAPTENDIVFRKSLLVGVVHDQGAAMHGGTAGHAGLFGSATDLAKLGQMLLQEGTYGGIRYYKRETVRVFSQKQFLTNRRGLGWEKPAVGSFQTPTSIWASPKTYGHTGFTGTCIWIDPEFNLVYVFLSNRVHPDMTNNKLLNTNIRSRIQDVIYQSMFEYCKTAGPQLEPATQHVEATGSTSQ
jgi:beta-N-acetylhexosaminidase